MKKIAILCLAVMILAGITEAKINLPQPTEIKLANGLTVMVIERHTLPLFSIQMTFRGGSIYDPMGREGLAGFCSQMLMRGTKTRTAKQIAEGIAFDGGDLNSFCSQEMAGFRGEFLSDKGDKGLAILSDMLLHSAFSADEVEKTRERISAELASRFDDPSQVADEKIYGAVFGSSRYAHLVDGTVGALKATTRDDLVSFFRKYYAPDNCLLVISGDVDAKTAKSWAETYFGKWTGKGEVKSLTETFPNPSGNEILLYDKKDATQTQIRFGGLGMSIADPGYVPFEAVRTIFGGSFTSRLNDEIRVKRGLSYGASCRSSRFGPAGIVYITTFSKNATVGQVVDLILSETRKIQTEAAADSEFTGGINYRSGLYPTQFETNDAIAGTYSSIWFYKLDKSIYEDFQEKLRAIKPDQGKAAAAKYLPGDNYRLVLVGKADEIKPQVEKYGKVTVLPLSTD